MPILTAQLLKDNGRHQLNEKMQEMVDLIKRDPLDIMEQKEDSEENVNLN